jgi:hypothetical protein
MRTIKYTTLHTVCILSQHMLCLTLNMDLCSLGRSTEVTMPEVHEGKVFEQNIFPDSKDDVK